jgi:hypothetical protein
VNVLPKSLRVSLPSAEVEQIRIPKLASDNSCNLPVQSLHRFPLILLRIRDGSFPDSQREMSLSLDGNGAAGQVARIVIPTVSLSPAPHLAPILSTMA